MQIYHNPRCSKSRQTLALLQDAGVDTDILEYLKTPPSRATLQQLHQALGGDVRQMLRFKEELARELGLSPKDTRPDAEWLDILAAHPSLLERPIVLRGDQARIGRPPETVLELLD
ncbi:MAG: arsenate reductase (glutaredoxin) [Oceanococcaceae bacterium]